MVIELNAVETTVISAKGVDAEGNAAEITDLAIEIEVIEGDFGQLEQDSLGGYIFNPGTAGSRGILRGRAKNSEGVDLVGEVEVQLVPGAATSLALELGGA